MDELILLTDVSGNAQSNIGYGARKITWDHKHKMNKP